MNKKILNPLLNFGILISSLTLLIFYCRANDQILSALFNADALYLPALIDDLFKQGGQLSDWYLTPAPYLFPDSIIYSIAWLLGESPAEKILAFAVLQIAISTAFAYLIYHNFVKTNAGSAAVLTAISLIFLGITIGSTSTLSKTGNGYLFIFTSAFHYGVFLAQLAFLCIAFLYKNADKSRKPIWIAILSTIAFTSALSDSLFIVQFSIPFIGTLLASRVTAKNIGLYTPSLITATLFSSLLGMKSYDFFISNNTKYPISIEVDKFDQQANFLHNFFLDLFNQQPLLAIFLIAFYGLALTSIFYWPKTIINKKESIFLRFLLTFSFISALTTITATTVVTNLSSGPRYLIPIFYWPPIIAISMVALFIRSHQFQLIALSLLSILALKFIGNDSSLNNQTATQPTDISCIIENINASGLSRGIATYWDAKPIQVFSGGKIKVAQYTGDLNEHRWITSGSFYQKTYDFAIVSEDQIEVYKLDRDKIIRANGDPKKEINCGQKTLLTYPRGQMLLNQNKFSKAGSFYTWKACELPTRIGIATPDCEMDKENIASSGHITFGPYEQLPAGSYNFEIAYSSTGNKGEVVGDWDVVLALPKEAKVLNNGLITGTDGATKKVVENFALDSGQNLEKIEIRTLARPNVDLKIIYLRVDRVQ